MLDTICTTIGIGYYQIYTTGISDIEIHSYLYIHVHIIHPYHCTVRPR